MESLYCILCGNYIVEDYNYCPHCNEFVSLEKDVPVLDKEFFENLNPLKDEMDDKYWRLPFRC